MTTLGTSILPSVDLRPQRISVKELEYIAFSGEREIAHGIFRSIAQKERVLYANKYILHEVIAGGIQKLKTFLSASAEAYAQEEKSFIDATLQLFIETSNGCGTYSRQLFESILIWSDELVRLSLLREALTFYDKALEMHSNKFPDLHVRILLDKARVLNMIGCFRDAQAILNSLATRPYVIADRNLVPEVFFNLGKESLLKGEIEYYKNLMFLGLRHFYTKIQERKLFVDQIVKTYRRSYRVLLDANLSFTDRLLFMLHKVFFAFQSKRAFQLVLLPQILRFLVLGYVYYLNYGSHRGAKRVGDAPPERHSSPRFMTRTRRNFLVTRAMGGIGDLLMMTPGLHELKRRHPHDEIHLALPRRYFPIFNNNPDVTLLDIETMEVHSKDYKRWFNFTDCPAARVESRTAPRVKSGRIDIFARALGIGLLAVRRMDNRPRYEVTQEERSFQAEFWNSHGLDGKAVVGIQLHADEVYRDYPNMPQLVAVLGKQYHVLLFDVEKIVGFQDVNAIKVERLPMRKAFALASSCDVIVAPDSAFVHLSAALDVPCVALYGPIDGKVRTRYYPKCKYLDVRDKLGCMPCWRNERIPCKLTNMKTSVCMADIAVRDIVTSVEEVLSWSVPV